MLSDQSRRMLDALLKQVGRPAPAKGRRTMDTYRRILSTIAMAQGSPDRVVEAWHTCGGSAEDLWWWWVTETKGDGLMLRIAEKKLFYEKVF